MLQTPRLVFSNTKYLLLGFTIFFGMLFALLLVSEYIFLAPYVVGHVPMGTEFGLLLIVVLCGLSSLVIPMNVFRIITLRGSKRKMGGGVFGSAVGAIAGACSCGPLGFAIISTFGSIGATASTFLTNYEIPIRIAAIVILLFAYYATVRTLKIECNIGKLD
ncbi:MAG: hypothetical protein OXC46_04135 [Thaumarchaeota archaeon]|nr:hypothetical protein [Nitrososphaerota archaeon]